MIQEPIVTSGILKIASRCNINCKYCYMYNLTDQTYTDQPKTMSRDTVVAVFDWVERYLAETDLADFHFSLHGGEPLLAGQPLVSFIADCRDAVQARSSKRIGLSLVTNGLLLDDQWIDLFASRDIRFGLSIDGPREYHDRFRLTKTGEGTHKQVEEQIRWIQSSAKALSAFSSVLCVIHPDMD